MLLINLSNWAHPSWKRRRPLSQAGGSTAEEYLYLFAILQPSYQSSQYQVHTLNSEKCDQTDNGHLINVCLVLSLRQYYILRLAVDIRNISFNWPELTEPRPLFAGCPCTKTRSATLHNATLTPLTPNAYIFCQASSEPDAKSHHVPVMPSIIYLPLKPFLYQLPFIPTPKLSSCETCQSDLTKLTMGMWPPMQKDPT